jgi:hypothetical protein
MKGSPMNDLIVSTPALDSQPISGLPNHIIGAANYGWKLFPVEARGKKPLIEGWPERATSIVAELDTWAKQFPSCNWGMATGKTSGVFVLDADGPQGTASVVIMGVPETMVVTTGRVDDGRHFYYLLPNEETTIRNSTGKVAPGIDIRGDGGYVVIPPSVHSSGKVYDYSHFIAPVIAPDWLVKLAQGPSVEPSAPLPSDYAPATDEQKLYAQNILAKQCLEFAGMPAGTGTRNDALNRMCYTLGGLIRTRCLDQNVVEQKVFAAVAGYAQTEGWAGVYATMRSGLTSGYAKPWFPPVAPEINPALRPSIENQFKEQFAGNNAEAVKLAANREAERARYGSEDTQEAAPHQWSLPPGLLGSVAEFIYIDAYRPNQEVALAGAIAFVSGVCGRQYNISRTGLNQYIALLAETSRGKEGAARGIGTLVNAINRHVFKNNRVLDVQKFIGPGMASTPALKRHLAEISKCFHIHIGELGKTLKKMTMQGANVNDIELMGTLMDVFMKSGKNDVLPGKGYSKKADNIPSVQSPCVTVLGDSTPNMFYEAMGLGDFNSGLIPRFTIIEHKGGIPKKNEFSEPPSEDLVKQLINMIRTVNQLEHENKVIEISILPDAKAFADRFEEQYSRRIEQEQGPLAELWSRSHLRLLRLVGAVAVGCVDWTHDQSNYDEVMPFVSLPMIEWAAGVIERSNRLVENRLAKGGIGEKADAIGQRHAIENCISRFFTAKYDHTWKTYGVTEEMHKAGRISWRYIYNLTKNAKCFERSNYDGAAKSILKSLIAADNIREIQVPSKSNNGAVSLHFDILTIQGLHRD